MGKVARLPARSASFWFGLAAAIIAITLLTGAITNRHLVDQVVSINLDSQQELRCRAVSQIGLEVVTAQVTQLKAQLDVAQAREIDLLIARDPAVTEQRKVVTDLATQLANLDTEIKDAIAARSASVEGCKNP